jgi:hypothetical protein
MTAGAEPDGDRRGSTARSRRCPVGRDAASANGRILDATGTAQIERNHPVAREAGSIWLAM